MERVLGILGKLGLLGNGVIRLDAKVELEGVEEDMAN